MVTEQDDQIEYFTPKQVAAKIGVEPNLIGNYFNEFRTYLEEHTTWTKEINGHKRYDAQGVAIFFEIKRLLNEGNTFEQIRTIFNDRELAKHGGSVAKMIDYENNQLLGKLHGADHLILKHILEINEQNKLYQQSVTGQINKLTEQIENQSGKIASQNEQIEKLEEMLRARDEQIAAKTTLNILESQGDPSWIDKLFRRDNIKKREEQKEHCKSIISRDRIMNTSKVVIQPIDAEETTS